MKKKANIFISIFLMSIISLILCNYSIYAESDIETVKIGYFINDGLQEKSDDGTLYGYCYEYLKEIADYTGWNYDFVTASYAECCDMLEKGEIDLICVMPKTDENIEKFDFTYRPTLSSTLCLYTQENNKNFAYEDFEAFDGMTVGIKEDYLGKEDFKNYAQENDFSFKYVYFDGNKNLINALINNKVDTILLEDIYQNKGLRRIGDFQIIDYYFSATKGNQQLLQEVNETLKKIKSDNYNFELDLYYKYYTDYISTVPSFTREELDFINTSEPITVALYGNRPNLSYFDEETNTYTGITYELINLIAQRTGLKFEFVNFPLDETAENFLSKGEADMVGPLLITGRVPYSDKLYTLGFDINSELVLIGSKDLNFKDTDSFVIAYPQALKIVEDKFKGRFPNAQFVYCENVNSGLKQVYNKQADFTIESKIVAAYRLKSPYYENFDIYDNYGFTETMCLGILNEKNPTLTSIIHKTTQTISSNDIDKLLTNYSMKSEYKLSFNEWLYEYRVLLTVYIIFFAIIFSMVFLLLRFRKRIQRAKQEELINKAKLLSEQEYQQALLKQMHFDSLTGIYNREYFFEKTQEMLDANPDTQYAIIRFNIEKFKLINSMFGTKLGDEILQYIANYIKTEVGNIGTYGRINSDHFIVCIPKEKYKRDTIKNKLLTSFSNENCSIKINMKAGVYFTDDVRLRIEEMSDLANLAIQSLKGKYNSTVSEYNKKLMNRLVSEQIMTAEMETALAEGQFQVYLQPQINLLNGGIIGGEALVRWIHPEKGLVPPNEFIPLFERNGFITALDEYVWEQACCILKGWLDKGINDLHISVNVSRVDLYNTNFCDRLIALVNKYGIPAALFHLEITETAYMDNPSELIVILHELMNKGFIVEMDDFGSGYSSLNMLKDVPVDILKLDLRFLESESNPERGRSILYSAVQMAKSLCLVVIAEGVETEIQEAFLRNIGCEMAQGYLYSQPIPVLEFEELINSTRFNDLKDKKVTNTELQLITLRRWLFNKKLDFLSVFAHMPIGVVIYEYTSKINQIFANKRYYELIEYDAEALKEEVDDIMSLVVTEDREAIIEAIQRLKKSSDITSYDFRQKMPDGKLKHFKCYTSRFSIPEGTSNVFISIIEEA